MSESQLPVTFPGSNAIEAFIAAVNRRFGRRSPFYLIVATAAATLAVSKIYRILTRPDFAMYAQRRAIRWVGKIPSVARRLADEKDKLRGGFARNFKRYEGERIHTSLPAEGIPADQVIQEAKEISRKLDKPWENGAVSGAVYHGGAELTNLLCEINKEYFWSNPLHPELFAGTKKLESEVVSMILGIYNAPEGSAGCLTTGGTESIIMAMKAYRDWARDRGVTSPNFVAPVTAHAAFDKGAAYFGIQLRSVPVDANGRAIPKLMAKQIDRNTIAIMGSAPCYSVGAFDPIEELAALAKRKGVNMHVDACLGGFLIPFMKEAGFDAPNFDFRVDGVTSISCDTHKYGFAPKGSSCLMYRDAEMRKYQFFAQVLWPGGLYASPTMTGSRSGSIVAGAWAVLMHFGRNGYVETTRKIVGTAKAMGEGLKKIEGLKLMSEVQVSVVSFTVADGFNFQIYDVLDHLGKKGWMVNALQFPPGIHIAITLLHTQPGIVEKFVADAKEGVDFARSMPPGTTGKTARTYGMAAQVPKELLQELAGLYFDVYYDVDAQAAHPHISEVTGH